MYSKLPKRNEVLNGGEVKGMGKFVGIENVVAGSPIKRTRKEPQLTAGLPEEGFSSEKEVVDYLFKGYKEGGCYVAKHVSVPTFYKWGIADLLKHIDHPMQPEIDILFYNPETDKLHAVEVKYFRLTMRKVRSKTVRMLGINEEPVVTPKSYYVGIDEAMALLSYGVDFAWLFHVGLPPEKGMWMKRILEMTPIGYMTINEDVDVFKEPMENPLIAMQQMKELREKLISCLKEERRE